MNDWGSGLQGQIAVTNDQAVTLSNWKVEFDFGRTINNLWDGQIASRVGNRYTVTNASYNATLAPGQTIIFGFVAGAGTGTPTNITLVGAGTTPPPPVVLPSITIGDVTGICERKPEVCEVGGALVGSMGVRAREGARLAYEALDGQFGEAEAESALARPSEATPAFDPEMTTGSVPAQTF